MNDETKRKPIDEIRDAFHLIHRVATGQSDRGYMSIPPNPARDADLIVDAAIDELEALRARVAELEAEVSRRDALIRADGYEDMRQHAQGLAAELALAHERLDEFGMRRDGSKATVVEGIAAMRDRIGELRAWAHASETEASGAEARVKELRDALKTEVESLARDMATMTRTANAEVEAGLALKAQLDEAVAALRALTLAYAAKAEVGTAVSFSAKLRPEGGTGRCWRRAVDLLAKHPEGK